MFQVLKFADRASRDEFSTKIQTFLTNDCRCGIGVDSTRVEKEREMLKGAVTKFQRQALLDRFFRETAAHVSIKHLEKISGKF